MWLFCTNGCISFSLSAQVLEISFEMCAHESNASISATSIDSLIELRDFEHAEKAIKKHINYFKNAKQWDCYFKSGMQLVTLQMQIQDSSCITEATKMLRMYDSLAYDQPRIVNNLYMDMGNYYAEDRSFTAATHIYDRALKFANEHLSHDTASLAKLYNNIGSFYMYIGNYEESANFLENALSFNMSLPKTAASIEASVNNYINLGIIFKELGKYDEAVDYYLNALKINQQGDSSIVVGKIHYNLAYAYYYKGDYFVGITSALLAENVFKYVLGEEHGFLVVSYNLISQFYEQLQDDRAAVYMQKALDLSLRLYGSSHTRVAIQHLRIGGYHNNENNHSPAIQHLTEAVRIFRLDQAANTRFLIESYQKLMDVYGSQGTAVDSIKKYADLSLEFEKLIFGERNHRYSDTYDALIVFLITSGKYAAAEHYLKQSFYNNTSVYDTLGSLNLSETDEYIDQAMAVKTLLRCAELEKSRMKKNGFNIDRWNQAQAYLDQAVQMKREMTHYFNNNIREEGEHSMDIELTKIELYLRFLQDLPPDKLESQVFHAFELYKGTKLLQSRLTQEVWSNMGLPDSLINVDDQYAATIDSIEQNLTYERTSDLIERLSTKRNERAAFNDQMAQEYPEYKVAISDSNLVGLETIQHTLNEEEVIFQYIFDEFTESYYTLVVDKQDVEAYVYPIPTSFNTQVEELHTLLGSLSLNRKAKRDRFIDLSNELYTILIAPFEAHLQNKQKIIVLGDQLTHFIPFEVLLKENSKVGFQDLEYLLRQYEISYHYSATMYYQSVKNEVDIQHVFAFAPVFDNVQNEKEIIDHTVNEVAALRATDASGEYFPLKFSRQEVQSIAQLFNSAERTSDVALYEQADKRRLIHALQSDYDVIHIASHSFVNELYSGASGIACFQADTTSKFNDLQLSELQNLRVNADLVTLSSCESGIGKMVLGEGLIGLNRGLIFSGANNVIFSQWKVYDKFTSEFMREFYKHFLNGKTYSAALQSTKLDMIKKSSTTSPQYWSAFLLIGR